MKAITYYQYGSPEVLQIENVPEPVPADNEVLIKVHAASVTTGDVNIRGFTFVPPGFGPLPRLMFGIREPRKKIIGTEVAGVVAAVGKDVTDFKAGDRVFGMDSATLGAYAEYVCRPADSALSIIPDKLTYEEAVAIPFGAMTALYFLRELANIQAGQTVLVNGASGGTGNYAVQLAKYFGAEVTGVCSTRNIEMVKSLGADYVIDYTQEDFTQNGKTYDIIFDSVAGKVSFSRVKNSLTENGQYLAVAGGMGDMLQSVWTSMFGSKKLVAGGATEKKDDLEFLAGLAEQGTIKALIDRCYPFEEIVEAHRYVDTGRKRGNVVITFTNNIPEGANA